MEYMSDSYRRSNGRILTTTDGFKYSKYKVKENTTYLRCVLSKNGCKEGTAKLKLETDLIYPSSLHNHGIDKYNSGVYELKTKCKKRAQTTQDNLRKIFDDETRTSLLASEISFNECESSMYRSRRRLQPKVPLTIGAEPGGAGGGLSPPSYQTQGARGGPSGGARGGS